MSRIFVVLVGVASLALLAVGAQAAPRVGTIVQRMTGHITGPSSNDTAAVRVFRIIKDGPWYGQLLVLRRDGSMRWQGPRSTDFKNHLVFWGGIAGDTTLEAVGDFLGDGHGAVVVLEAQSDVRVEHFRVLRWNGKELTFVRSEGLVETPEGSGHFVWDANSDPRSRWISHIRRIISPGRLEVVVNAWKDLAHRKIAVVRADRSGFSIVR